MSVVLESTRSVRVSWLPPNIEYWNGVVTGYAVIYVNNGPLDGSPVEDDGSGSGLSPLTVHMISVPPPGYLLSNSPDPALVSLPLKTESVVIENLEEFHSYSFTVYQENSEGIGPLSMTVIQDTPEDGKN